MSSGSHYRCLYEDVCRDDAHLIDLHGRYPMAEVVHLLEFSVYFLTFQNIASIIIYEYLFICLYDDSNVRDFLLELNFCWHNNSKGAHIWYTSMAKATITSAITTTATNITYHR